MTIIIIIASTYDPSSSLPPSLPPSFFSSFLPSFFSSFLPSFLPSFLLRHLPPSPYLHLPTSLFFTISLFCLSPVMMLWDTLTVSSGSGSGVNGTMAGPPRVVIVGATNRPQVRTCILYYICRMCTHKNFILVVTFRTRHDKF